MNREQVIQLLKLLAAAFPTMKLTKNTLDGWLVLLSDEDPLEILAAAIVLSKTRADRDFMPTPAAVIDGANEMRSKLAPSDKVWSSGPAAATNDHEKDVWRRWGGLSRWNSLPDPLYCDDAIRAHSALSFARKEFAELYHSIKRDNRHLELTAGITETLKTYGLDFRKIYNLD